MVTFCRCLAVAWFIASVSADPETCDQEDGQCVSGDVFLQKGRERSTAPEPLVALEEDSQLEQDLALDKTFISEEPLSIGVGTDARELSFDGSVIGGQATNRGSALAAAVMKKAGGTAEKAQYLFYAKDGSNLRVVVVEVTRSGCCHLFARVVAAKRGNKPNTDAGAMEVVQRGTTGLLAPVHTGKGFGVGLSVGRRCDSNAGHCSRCSADGQTCLVCENAYTLEGYYCRKTCEAISVKKNPNSALNLIFVPSGFKGEMAKWPQAVQTINAQFAAYPLLAADSIDELNVFYAKDPAPDDDGAQCNFGCKRIPRLLCCNNALFERHAWRTCGSGFQVQIVVVHNSDKYGGAGGRLATTSINSAAPKIAAHEIGHSMFKLGDEYKYGKGNTRHANCDQRGCPKWNDMIQMGFPGVKCVQGSCKNGQYYASSDNTIMKALNGPFSPVQERDACCKYLQFTGSAPALCNKFNNAQLPRKLNEYCQHSLLLLSTGREAGKEADSYNQFEDERYVQVRNPVEWELVKQEDESDKWICVKIGKLAPGVYPQSDVEGDADIPLVEGTITVKVSSGAMERQLKFNMYDTIEVPPLENDAEFDEGKFEEADRRMDINLILEEGETCEVI